MRSWLLSENEGPGPMPGFVTGEPVWGRAGRVTVLGPCPGCGDWQLDFDEGAVNSYVDYGELPMRGAQSDGVHEWMMAQVQGFMRQAQDVVEQVIWDHALRECPGLLAIADELMPHPLGKVRE